MGLRVEVRIEWDGTFIEVSSTWEPPVPVTMSSGGYPKKWEGASMLNDCFQRARAALEHATEGDR